MEFGGEGRDVVRVCMITGSYPPMKTGGADPIRNLCRHLAQRGMDVDVITVKGVPHDDENRRITVYPVVKEYEWDRKQLIPVLKILARTRPDVVNIQYEETSDVGQKQRLQLRHCILP